MPGLLWAICCVSVCMEWSLKENLQKSTFSRDWKIKFKVYVYVVINGKVWFLGTSSEIRAHIKLGNISIVFKKILFNIYLIFCELLKA